MASASLRGAAWSGPLLYNPVDSESLHCGSANCRAWSRANLEEAAPGVITPLSWSFTNPSTVVSSRIIFSLMGVMSAREMAEPVGDPGDAPSTLFFGRMALNVDYMRRFLARVPGADPDEFERQILGTVRGLPLEPKQRWRVPLIAAKVGLNARRFPGCTARNSVEVESWWRRETAAAVDHRLDQAVALFDDALRRHALLVGVHSFGFLVGQNHFSNLAKLCLKCGLAGHELLLSGHGLGTVETQMVDDVRSFALGELAIGEFLADHGYRGPHEGELSSKSWREDPGPIHRLADLYRHGGPERPDTEGRFDGALSELLSRRPRWRRASTRRLVGRVVQYTQLREVGKATFVRSKDVGRASARRIGQLLHEAGSLDDPEDVFFLSREELDGDLGSAALRERVTRRKLTRHGFEDLELPDHFVGIPEPMSAANANPAIAELGAVVTGIAASSGVAEGIARVVRDPSQLGEFEPGDVLICELTDPAWAPLMYLASAVVIDIGGPLSHGAIVARELGIPAVIGTGTGTSRLAEGSTVRVDGTAGTVTVLASAPGNAEPRHAVDSTETVCS